MFYAHSDSSTWHTPILHVEDDKAQQDVLKAILEGNGWAVLQASNAEDALKLCRETPVSLVLADHMLLGGTTGSQLARQIKALKPTVPIVLHSGLPPASMKNLERFIHKGEPVRFLLEFLRDLINRLDHPCCRRGIKVDSLLSVCIGIGDVLRNGGRCRGARLCPFFQGNAVMNVKASSRMPTH